MRNDAETRFHRPTRIPWKIIWQLCTFADNTAFSQFSVLDRKHSIDRNSQLLDFRLEFASRQLRPRVTAAKNSIRATARNLEERIIRAVFWRDTVRRRREKKKKNWKTLRSLDELRRFNRILNTASCIIPRNYFLVFSSVGFDLDFLRVEYNWNPTVSLWTLWAPLLFERRRFLSIVDGKVSWKIARRSPRTK